MYAFQIGDLESVMNIPVPFRKWLIERWNKQKEKEYKAQNGNTPDVNQPLSEQDRMKFIKKAQEASNKPMNKNMMQPTRNGK